MSKSLVVNCLAAAMLVALAACAQESDDNPFVASGPGPQPTEPDGPRDDPRAPDSIKATVQGALDDVESFWTDEYPKLFDGNAFDPVGDYYGYGPNTAMPPCGDPPPSYTDIQDNAFYCPEGDLIAADEEKLLPYLSENFGPFTIGIVFAHEYGHAIQTRSGVATDRSVVIEMQADCYAGAWTKWVADGNSDNFAVKVDQLDDSLAGMTTISDQAGTDPNEVGAHGSAFDRLGSFQDGFEHGAERCAEYDSDPDLPIVEMTFSDDDDIATGGNLHPFDEGGDKGLLSLAKEDLNDFYTQLFSEKLSKTFTPVDDLVVPDSGSITCNGENLDASDINRSTGYCEDENTVVIGKDLIPDYYEIGDFALGAEVARLWADAAQLQLGIDDTSKDVSLQADCLTGFWAFSRFPVDQNGNPRDLGDVKLSLSPGDLDEGIRGFITSDAGEGADEVGTVFERVGALRSGFLNGLDGCTAIAPLGD
jgi:predicted metalloprotease